MTNKEKYKQAFSALYASGDFSLEVTGMEQKKSHKNIKIAAIVLAAVLLLSVGAVAANHGGFVRHVEDWSEDRYETLEELNAASSKLLGLKTPEAFSNGFTFVPGSKQIDATTVNEDGDRTDFTVFDGRYVRDDAVVKLQMFRGLELNPYLEYTVMTVGDTDFYVLDFLGPLDPSMTDYQYRAVLWYVGDVTYKLESSDGHTQVSDLLDMAAEIIGK